MYLHSMSCITYRSARTTVKGYQCTFLKDKQRQRRGFYFILFFVLNFSINFPFDGLLLYRVITPLQIVHIFLVVISKSYWIKFSEFFKSKLNFRDTVARRDVTWRDVTWRDVTWRDVTQEGQLSEGRILAGYHDFDANIFHVSSASRSEFEAKNWKTCTSIPKLFLLLIK